ncbi:hypothetical protein KIN20_033371 [Parelaphostrongylus tenuis]|uniref:Uncharacterized protein n=1 Tax=Parelaphostrongylus tenuis TaxID=148309 RepID=A0AAD5WIT7_PARTN|nr:hypothetical protein KIN20_033371 [Parelaphostrongylus tenuis]
MPRFAVVVGIMDDVISYASLGCHVWMARFAVVVSILDDFTSYAPFGCIALPLCLVFGRCHFLCLVLMPCFAVVDDILDEVVSCAALIYLVWMPRIAVVVGYGRCHFFCLARIPPLDALFCRCGWLWTMLVLMPHSDTSFERIVLPLLLIYWTRSFLMLRSDTSIGCLALPLWLVYWTR